MLLTAMGSVKDAVPCRPSISLQTGDLRDWDALSGTTL